MKPPDDSPDTVVCDLSMTSCGSGAACGARAMPPSSDTASAAKARRLVNMACLPEKTAGSWPGLCGSTLVADRHAHLFRFDLAHELGHAPGEGRVHLDLEVVHRLHRLVVFLAEGHLALGRVEAHALHRADE